MNSKEFDRRSFLQLGSAAALALGMPGLTASAQTQAEDAESTQDRAAGTVGDARSGTTELDMEVSVKALDAADDIAWSNLRSLFPLRTDRIYMNCGGLGPASFPVLRAHQQAAYDLAVAGEEQRKHIKATRRQFADVLGCAPEELAFTAGTTSAMNMVAGGLKLQAGDEILMSTHEHPGGAMIWVKLARDIGCKVTLFEPRETAEATVNAVQAMLTPKTRVLVVSHVTCTTGLRMPVKSLVALCRAHGCLSVIDGAHPLGMMPLNLHEIACDFYVSSGHKWLFGPQGSGLLYVRQQSMEHWSTPVAGAYADSEYSLEDVTFVPLKKARSVEIGTYDTAKVVGLGAALTLATNIGLENIARRGAYLAQRIKTELLAIPGVKLLTPPAEEDSSAIVTFQSLNDQVDPQELLKALMVRDGIRLRFVVEHGLNAVRIAPMYCSSEAELEVLFAALRRELG